jgi:hypothetical protein
MIEKRQVQIMGSSFYPNAGTCIARMRLGQPLIAKREPTNKYDRNAVAVYQQNMQLGHFPRGFAAEVAPLMDAGTANVKVWKSKNPKFLGVGIIVVQWENGKPEEEIDPAS